MEIKTTLFFDTYAFFEILLSNPNYSPYIKTNIVTTKLNLMELHYGLLLKVGKGVADLFYEKYLPYAVEIDDEIIKLANELKASLRKRDISYIDCIGYTIARSRNIKFLTGDKEFKDLENVEFVK